MSVKQQLVCYWVYKIILCIFPAGNKRSPDQSGSRPSDKQVHGTVMRCDRPTFTLEQEKKYRRRYEEGFDLPDEQYEAWLKINHPDHTRAGNSNTEL